MVEKIKIARIGFFDKDKSGNPLKTKDGKPYERCLIDTVDGRKISGFANVVSRTFKEGDEVELDIEKSGEYWNFKTLKANGGVSQEQFDRLEKLIVEIHNRVVPKEPIRDPNDF